MEILKKIKERFSDVEEIPSKDNGGALGGVHIKVPAEQTAGLAGYLKKDLGFDLLCFMTAVDWIKDNKFEIVYHLMNTSDLQTDIFIKVDVPREGDPSVPSLSHMYQSADWQERETYDLYGIRFTGHPQLKRILLWEGYHGWPLRKDYVHTRDKFDEGDELGLPIQLPPPVN